MPGISDILGRVTSALERRGLKGTATFGKDIAARARQHGVSVGMYDPVMSLHWKPESSKRMFDIVNRLRRFTGVHAYSPEAGINIPDDMGRGVVINPVGMAPWEHHPDAHFIGKLPEGTAFSDKLHESLVFGDSLPETHSLRSLLEKAKLGPSDLAQSHELTDDGYNTPDLRNRLKALFQKTVGDNYILKPVGGRGSKGDLMTEGFHELPTSTGSMMDLLLQKRTPIARTSGLERFYDRLSDLRDAHPHASLLDNARRAWGERGDVGSLYGASSTGTKGTQEYRVHAVGGKVIRNGTVRRGSILGSINPFQSRFMDEAEQHVQDALDKLPPEYRDLTYGFDVGKARDTGKPFIIEPNATDTSFSNPHSGFSSGSGFFAHPYALDALQANVRGTLPLRRRLQNVIQYGIPITGLGAIGHRELNKESSVMNKSAYAKGFMDKLAAMDSMMGSQAQDPQGRVGFSAGPKPKTGKISGVNDTSTMNGANSAVAGVPTASKAMANMLAAKQQKQASIKSALLGWMRPNPATTAAKKPDPNSSSMKTKLLMSLDDILPILAKMGQSAQKVEEIGNIKPEVGKAKDIVATVPTLQTPKGPKPTGMAQFAKITGSRTAKVSPQPQPK